MEERSTTGAGAWLEKNQPFIIAGLVIIGIIFGSKVLGGKAKPGAEPGGEAAADAGSPTDTSRLRERLVYVPTQTNYSYDNDVTNNTRNQSTVDASSYNYQDTRTNYDQRLTYNQHLAYDQRATYNTNFGYDQRVTNIAGPVPDPGVPSQPPAPAVGDYDGIAKICRPGDYICAYRIAPWYDGAAIPGWPLTN